MLVAQIIVDGQVVDLHSSTLAAQSDRLPPGSKARRLEGDVSENATAYFMSRLQQGADAIGEHSDVVRVSVRENAEALRKAVQDFDEQEHHSEQWAKDRNELINQTAEHTTDEQARQAEETRSEEERSRQEPAQTQAPTENRHSAKEGM